MTNQVGDTTKGFGGPETLREWAKNHTHLFEDEEEFIVAAAAAWEATERALVVAGDTAMELSKRLEAAEKALAAANDDNAASLGNGYGAWTRQSETQKMIDAALAGEKPDDPDRDWTPTDEGDK